VGFFVYRHLGLLGCNICCMGGKNEIFNIDCSDLLFF
jgi:hypothetical protein